MCVPAARPPFDSTLDTLMPLKHKAFLGNNMPEPKKKKLCETSQVILCHAQPLNVGNTLTAILHNFTGAYQYLI